MIRSLLFRNLGLKILSLCFAVVLWYSVVSERQSNLLVTVPLTFVNVPKTMKVRVVSDERARLHLEGPISALRSMEIGKIRGTIDLSGAHEGKSRFELLPSHFNVPDGIRVIGISPEVVYVVLEKLQNFQLPVKVRLKGKVDPHFTIREIDVAPQSVWVVGDRKARAYIENIPTDYVDVDGLKKDLKKDVSLVVPREVRLKGSLDHVAVTVKLREKVWDKEVDGIRVRVDSPNDAYVYTIDPRFIKVRVRGWATIVDVLSSSDIRALVSVKAWTPGVHALVPKIGVPSGVKVLSIEPPMVKVRVEKRVRE